MSNAVNTLYEFGSFRLDTVSGTLWRGSDVISLSPKSAELLKLLLEREGRVVSKQEIFDTVWADTFVEDGVLTQNIYTLRNAIGRDDDGRQFIETVPRRGYRFAGHVRKSKIESPTHRFRTGLTAVDDTLSADLLEDNSDISADRGPTGTPAAGSLDSRITSVGSQGLRYLLLAGLGLVILAAAGFGLYRWTREEAAKSDSTIAPIEQLRFQKVTDSGDVVFPTISPDGKMLAYVRLAEEQSSVWVKQIAGGMPIQTLPPTKKGYRSLAFSPNGQYLYYREEAEPGTIFQTPALGGPAKKVAENVLGDFSVSPDGKQFAFIRRDAGLTEHLLIVSNIDGSGEMQVAARSAPWDYRGGAPGWSPDGTKLIVASGQQQQFFPRLLLIDVATGEETAMKIPRWRAIFRVLWMPDGKRLIITAREANEPYSQMWMLTFPGGEIRRLTNDLESYFWLSMSADGQTLVTRQQRIISHVWLLPEGDIKRAKQLTFGERALDSYAGVAWTPDNRIVFSSFVNNVTDLYSMNPDGSDRVQLIMNAGQDNTDPSIASDASSIVFTSNRTGSSQIWRMDIDGRNPRQLTFDDNRKERAIAGTLSSDGREVFFIKHGAGPAAIWKMPIEGGEAVKVSRLTDATAESFVSVSPDGKWLAYRHVAVRQEPRGEERTIQIGVIPSDGSGEPKIFDLPMRRPTIQWAADSSAFYYSSGTFNSSALMRQPINGEAPQKLIDFPDRVFNFAWSHDGKNLAVARGKQLGDAILISNLP
ncbi:MAG TPA: winged helix-turn-helix domain-containing protein [Pyrinomonadaceae bacterium]|nr:winged helix-turn-helix domain-containing protein [Pyrinomonadaceae bacterium]